MKSSRSQNNKQNKQGLSRKPMPEIRDNLDSRKNEERDTHYKNRKDHKSNFNKKGE